MANKDFNEYFWLKVKSQDEFSVPIGVRAIRRNNDKVLVVDDDNKEYWIHQNDILKPMHKTSQNQVDDMIKLGDLQEYSIIRNLHARYKKKLIYTYIDVMLVAVNPYEILQIYNNRDIQSYRNKKLNLMPPHIFAVADTALQEMRSNFSNQCIVISGESGAGKTESTKFILQYLAATSGKHSWIEQQVIEANPIMEAFGNAKTIRNDNSSRFGKYIDIYFDGNGIIQGARIEQYLLEKSRIVSHNKEERNYHIFYSMLSGMSKQDKEKLDLNSSNHYWYLNQGGSIAHIGRNDAEEFNNIKSAMEVLSFHKDEVWNIFKLLAAILHFGNLRIDATMSNNMDSSNINDTANLNRISNLLGISTNALRNALTNKTIFIQGEKVNLDLSKKVAVESRDSFVKSIYGKVFLRLIDRINKTISKMTNKSFKSIGVLDIFGFENFNFNGFEQLCINYANENLQQFFVKHIFKLEQLEYKEEGINWENIEYVDNQEILDLIGQRPLNMMSLIDEECRFPNGSDTSLLEKLNKTYVKNSIYTISKSGISQIFGIRHYAGTVYYNSTGFLEKNKDSTSYDIKEMISQSTNKYLVELFAPDFNADTSKRTVAVSLQFRNSLDTLMKTLTICHPFFIRCIKPNEVKQPNVFDKSLCLRQLRYSGMMETAKIRKVGYPIRYSFPDFIERYRILLYKAKGIADIVYAKLICEKYISNSTYQIGHTKVFLKEEHDILLESERSKIYVKSIRIIQRGFRRIIFKRWLERNRRAAILIQKTWRTYYHHHQYQLVRKGFCKLQAILRTRVLRNIYQKKIKVFPQLQGYCRGYLYRKLYLSILIDRKKRIEELKMQRIFEMQQLKGAGNNNYERIAQSNFLSRMNDLQNAISSSLNGRNAINEIKAPELRKINGDFDMKDDSGVVDKAFEFLDNETQCKINEQKELIAKNNTKTIPLPKLIPCKDELSEYSFAKFGAIYFNGNVTTKYSKKLLKSSLLEHNLTIDAVSAQVIWITIVRFMGDMAEAKYEDRDSSESEMQTEFKTLKRSSSIMASLTQNLSKLKRQDNDIATDVNSNGSQLIQKTLKKKTKLPQFLQKTMNINDLEYYENFLKIRSSNLDKLHFIIGHGILRPTLRDEIYCQISKQLTDNPHQTSFAKGWILLSLCLGCFSPSYRFEKYLRNFIRAGPKLYAPYCEERLNRNLKNGNRTQPPSYLELHASRNKDRIIVNLILMDDSIRKLQIDSASTAHEAIEQISKSLGLIDYFGFSIVIKLCDKIMSLGHGNEHIMDAISNCEQYAKENGLNERKACWKLYLRKEIFSPWYDPRLDEVATDLIYQQVVRGIKFGEYQCKNETDIAMVCALRYYADFGCEMDHKIVRDKLSDYIPSEMLTSDEGFFENLVHLVIEAYQQNDYVKNKISQKCAKEDLIVFAQFNWSMLFSRFFEALKVNGPEVETNNVVIAINSIGVYLIDKNEKVLLVISYPEIVSISINNLSDVNEMSLDVDEITIRTIQKDDYTFKCFEAKDIYEILSYLLNNLKAKSIYVICNQTSNNASGDGLDLNYGDLIMLLNGVNGETILKSGTHHLTGECNGRIGLFPIDSVYILPTILRPSDFILKLFKDNATTSSKPIRCSKTTKRKKKNYTLKSFAVQHFRGAIKTSTNSLVTASKRNEELWKHSKTLIRAPLLKKLKPDKRLCITAVEIFSNILKYMGDVPRANTSLNTNLIFEPAMGNEYLIDEIYCQIMKQLTENIQIQSEEKGWDLMWMATGVMAPSSMIFKELTKFLHTRKHPLAAESLKRINKILRTGHRKYPPHIIEVESIQNRSIQIYHKIYFPDNTIEAFEIQSTTRIQDLIETISKRLNLKSTDGFYMFVHITDKLFSIPKDEFLFDYLTQLMEWIRENTPIRLNDSNDQKIAFKYQLHFMKKLWINIQPGKDLNADSIFYFPQELSKYLNGYYKLTKKQVIKIAALLYKIDFHKCSNMKIKEILSNLLPKDMISLEKLDEWKKLIENQIKLFEVVKEYELIKQFLNELSSQETFGSTFFIVKQSYNFNFPETILIAINRFGFHIIDPRTKNKLHSYELSELNFWSCGNTYFHISFGNMIGSTKLFFTTTLGYKIDDLLTSYIKLYQ